MITTKEAQEKLAGYPTETLDLYPELLEKKSPELLTAFVIGIITFITDSPTEKNGQPISDSTQLQNDLGADSIAIAEMIFLFEDIFEIEIDNAELMTVNTIGDLKNFILIRINSIED